MSPPPPSLPFPAMLGQKQRSMLSDLEAASRLRDPPVRTELRDGTEHAGVPADPGALEAFFENFTCFDYPFPECFAQHPDEGVLVELLTRDELIGDLSRDQRSALRTALYDRVMGELAEERRVWTPLLDAMIAGRFWPGRFTGSTDHPYTDPEEHISKLRRWARHASTEELEELLTFRAPAAHEAAAAFHRSPDAEFVERFVGQHPAQLPALAGNAHLEGEALKRTAEATRQLLADDRPALAVDTVCALGDRAEHALLQDVIDGAVPSLESVARVRALIEHSRADVATWRAIASLPKVDDPFATEVYATLVEESAPSNVPDVCAYVRRRSEAKEVLVRLYRSAPTDKERRHAFRKLARKHPKEARYVLAEPEADTIELEPPPFEVEDLRRLAVQALGTTHGGWDTVKWLFTAPLDEHGLDRPVLEALLDEQEGRQLIRNRLDSTTPPAAYLSESAQELLAQDFLTDETLERTERLAVMRCAANLDNPDLRPSRPPASEQERAGRAR